MFDISDILSTSDYSFFDSEDDSYYYYDDSSDSHSITNIRREMKKKRYVLDINRYDPQFVKEVYRNLPQTLITSVEDLSIKIWDSKFMNVKFGKLQKKYKLDKDKDLAFKYLVITILREISHFDVFSPTWKDIVFGYINPDITCKYTKFKLTGTKLLNSNYKSKISTAVLYTEDDEPGKEVVVKTCLRTSDIIYELYIYRTLRKMGCPLPWFSVNYSFWGQPVIVMKKLSPLPVNENPKSIKLRKLCRDILQQLKFIHKIGVHCDIKPTNILYDSSEDRYYLVDFDGMTIHRTKKAGYFVRHSHTEKFSSQKDFQETGESCSAINDFKELLFTLNYIAYKQIGADNEEIAENFRVNFLGSCKKFHKSLQKIGIPVRESIYDYLADKSI